MAQAEEPPTLTIPPWKIQELAQLVWISSVALRRYQQARDTKNREKEREEADRVRAGRRALGEATGDPDAATRNVPRPLDQDTFEAAKKLVTGAQQREADVVWFPARETWMVTGEVPGVGPVGVEVASQEQAEAARQMILTAPAGEVAEAFGLVNSQAELADGYNRADSLAAAQDRYPDLVAAMNPNDARDRAVARNLLTLGDQNITRAVTTKFGDDIATEAATWNAAATAAQYAEPEQPRESNDAPAPVSDQVNALRVTLKDGSGTAQLIDAEAAMALYPVPESPREPQLEVRDANNNLIEDPALQEQALIETINGMDPNNSEDRTQAVGLYNWFGPDVDKALHDRFPGLRSATAAHSANQAAGHTAKDANQARIERGKRLGPAGAEAFGAIERGATPSPDAKASAKKAAPKKGGPRQQPPQQTRTQTSGRENKRSR